MVFPNVVNPVSKETNVIDLDVHVPHVGEPNVLEHNVSEVVFDVIDVGKYFIQETKFILQ